MWFVNETLGGSSTKHVAQAMESGCDIGCDPFLNDFAKDALADASIRESTLDTAMKRLYKPWLELGNLDERDGSDSGSCTAFKDIGPEAIDTPLHRQLALEAAIQSMILLQNEGDEPLLPLAKGKSLALLGPHVNSTEALISIYHMDEHGIYSVLAEKSSPLMAIERHPSANVVGHEPGCADGVACLNTSGFGRAAALAKSADIAVVFVGLIPGHAEMPGEATGKMNMSCDAREDEGKDRPYTTLPGEQMALVRAIMAANRNVVLVAIHGGALSIDEAKENVPSIISAHYPGQQGGDAIAAVLFGDHSPSGRLTTSFYPDSFNEARNISDQRLKSNGGVTYMHYEAEPAYEFGRGLSYTKFEFSCPTKLLHGVTGQLLQYHPEYYRDRSAERSPLQVPVTVKNTGSRASSVVVLGFVSSNHTDAPRNKELFGYERVADVQPGASVTIQIGVPPQVLTLVDVHGVERLLPGEFLLEVGVRGSAEGEPASAKLVLSGEPLVVFSMPEARQRAAM